MKTDSNKSWRCRRDAAAVTESLALSEIAELYIFTQRCFLLIKPPRVFSSRRCCQYAGCLPASHLSVTRLLPWNKRTSGRLRERRPLLASPLSRLLCQACFLCRCHSRKNPESLDVRNLEIFFPPDCASQTQERKQFRSLSLQATVSSHSNKIKRVSKASEEAVALIATTR